MRKLAFFSLIAVSMSSGSMIFAQDQSANFETQELFANSGLQAINVTEAWTLGFTGAGVTIGIADGPMQYDHPEFAGRIRAPDPAPAFPLVGFEIPQHGTHVAGIAGAGRNGFGMMGVAFDVEIANARATSSPGYALNPDWADAIIASGASVMNGSFGPDLYPKRYLDADGDVPNPDWVDLPFQMITSDYVAGNVDSVRKLAEADVVMVFSAGNEFINQPTGARIPDGEAMFPLINPQNTADEELYRFVSDGTNENDPKTWIYSKPEEVGDLIYPIWPER